MTGRPDFQRRSTWIELLRTLGSVGPVSTSDMSGSRPPIEPYGADDPAIRAWDLVMDAGASRAAVGLLELAGPQGDGSTATSFLERPDDLAIEVWTECELSVLHAVWRWLLVTDGIESDGTRLNLRKRVVDAVAWHLEHTQPDNATTHPWAVHAFLELGGCRPEVIDYAGSILHAVEAAGYARDGIDPLSTWILRDAAWGLELRAGRPLGAGGAPGSPDSGGA